jgi:hypothetical protein
VHWLVYNKYSIPLVYLRHYILFYIATFNQLINVKICDLLSLKIRTFYMFIYTYLLTHSMKQSPS